MDLKIPKTLDAWNEAGADYLPGHLGITYVKVEPDEVIATMMVTKSLRAWNGFLHAGSVVTLADSCSGYGTIRSLPEGCMGFTTIELKSNFLGTAREGEVRCVAHPLHQGKSTQVWDATVTADATGKTMAHFRCTQMILWPK